jgi:hypothetical protein
MLHIEPLEIFLSRNSGLINQKNWDSLVGSGTLDTLGRREDFMIPYIEVLSGAEGVMRITANEFFFLNDYLQKTYSLNVTINDITENKSFKTINRKICWN